MAPAMSSSISRVPRRGGESTARSDRHNSVDACFRHASPGVSGDACGTFPVVAAAAVLLRCVCLARGVAEVQGGNDGDLDGDLVGGLVGGLVHNLRVALRGRPLVGRGSEGWEGARPGSTTGTRRGVSGAVIVRPTCAGRGLVLAFCEGGCGNICDVRWGH